MFQRQEKKAGCYRDITIFCFPMIHLYHHDADKTTATSATALTKTKTSASTGKKVSHHIYHLKLSHVIDGFVVFIVAFCLLSLIGLHALINKKLIISNRDVAYEKEPLNIVTDPAFSLLNSSPLRQLASSSSLGDAPRKGSQVAICIRGDDRGVDNAYNMYKSIIEPLDHADVFVVIHSAGDHKKYEADRPEKQNKQRRMGNDDDSQDEPLLVRGFKNLPLQYPDEITNPVHLVDHDYKKYNAKEIYDELIHMGMDDAYWKNFTKTKQDERIESFNRFVGDDFYNAYIRDDINKHGIYSNAWYMKKEYNIKSQRWIDYVDNYFGVNALGPMFGHGSAFYQFKDFHTCNELIAKHEDKYQFKYRYIVIARSDYWCLDKPLDPSKLLFPIQRHDDKETVPSNVIPNKIFIPKGEDYGGTNDRLIALPRQYATYFLTQPYVNLYQNKNPDWYLYNMETLINRTVSSIIDQSARLDADIQTQIESSFNIKNTRPNPFPTAELVRTDLSCFLACKYQAFQFSSIQSKDSWQACSSLSYRKFKSSFRSQPRQLRERRLPDYTVGYNGIKYDLEYEVAMNNSLSATDVFRRNK